MSAAETLVSARGRNHLRRRGGDDPWQWRARMTARPPRVFMRTRKPWVRLRRTTDGLISAFHFRTASVRSNTRVKWIIPCLSIRILPTPVDKSAPQFRNAVFRRHAPRCPPGASSAVDKSAVERTAGTTPTRLCASRPRPQAPAHAAEEPRPFVRPAIPLSTPSCRPPAPP